MTTSNNNKIILIAIIAILGFIFLSRSNFSSFSIVPTQLCSSVPSSIQGVSCANQVNGVITSLSQIQINSNFAPLNGEVWLVNFVLNGAGQSLVGTWNSADIAKQFNSSVQQNQQVGIQASLNSQNLVLPYYFSGYNLEKITIVPVNFTGGFNYKIPIQLDIVNEKFQYPSTFAMGCSGLDCNSDYQTAFNNFNYNCTSANGKTYLIQNGSATAQLYGFSVASAYEIECLQPASQNLGQLFFSASPQIAENISVIYSNNTGNHVMYLTTRNPESMLQNQLYAQIYGYNLGSLNTYIGTTSPTLFVPASSNLQSGTFLLPASTVSVQNLDQISSSCYEPAGVILAGQTLNYIYSTSVLNGCISQQNTNVDNYLSSTIQPQNAFYGMKFEPQYQIAETLPDIQSPYVLYGVLNITHNPILYPEIQMLSKASTLGLYIPVSYPTITNISPNPVSLQSGSTTQVSITVQSNASVMGSAYIVITAPNGTIVTQTQDFNVPANNNPVQELINIGGYSSSLANLQTTYTATVYSTELESISNSKTFGVNIKPNCPYGSTYVNNTNCQSTTHTCVSGYAWNPAENQCVSVCTAPSYFNTTTDECYVPPVQNSCLLGLTFLCNIPLWQIVLLVIVIIALYLAFGKRKGHKGIKIGLHHKSSLLANLSLREKIIIAGIALIILGVLFSWMLILLGAIAVIIGIVI